MNIIRSKLLRNKNNLRKQWKVVNELIGRDKRKSDIILKDSEGNIIQDGNIVAKMFNEFFCTVADKLRSEISRDKDSLITSNTPLVDNFHTQNICNSLFFFPTDKIEIKKIIRSFEN